MKTISSSDIKDLIRENSFRYFSVRSVSSLSDKYYFCLGRYNVFSGFVAEFKTRPITLDCKAHIVAMARCYGLIECTNF